MKSLILSLLAMLILSDTEKAQAAPFVCFTDGSTVAVAPRELESFNETQAMSLFFEHRNDPHLLRAPISCSAKAKIGLGTKATALVFQGGAFYAACTGVGAPIALWFEGGALGFAVIDLVVGEIPCEDRDTEAAIQKRVEQVVCTTLARDGVKCEFGP